MREVALDTEARSLLQVKIDHAEDAGNVFEALMGMLSSSGANSSRAMR